MRSKNIDIWEDKDADDWDLLESLPEQIEKGNIVPKRTIVKLLGACFDDLQRIARESYEAEIKLAVEKPMEYLRHSTGADETVSGYVSILKDSIFHLFAFLPDEINGEE